MPDTLKTPIKPADLAKIWNLTPGRISQLVRDGMPLTSVEDARQWRRKRLLECEHAGDPPDYLLSYHERVTIEQEIYDRLVYQHKVSDTIACKVCWEIFRRREAGLLQAGTERRFMFNGKPFPDGTWFALIMAHDPYDYDIPASDEPGCLNQDFLDTAMRADLSELRKEPGFLPSEAK